MPTAITHDPTFTTPVSSTNTAVVRWSGTAGAVLQDSGVLIDGSNNLIIPAQGDLRLSDTTGGQYVALQAAGTTTTHTLTLPATQGSASTFLQNNGSGALSWAAAGGDFSNGGDNGALVLGTNDSNSLTLETNNTARMVIAAGGQITLPTQPAFSAFNNATLADQTGNGANPTIRFNDEHFDVGGNFNTSTFTFTAPVTGIYLLMVRVYWDGRTTGSHQYAMTILTNNRNYENQWDLVTGTSGFQIQDQVLANMSAGHTSTVKAAIYGESTNQVDLMGDAAGRHTTFQGFLVA